MSEHAGYYRFVHVNRSGNELAHEIARFASSTSQAGVWFDVPPQFVSRFFT